MFKRTISGIVFSAALFLFSAGSHVFSAEEKVAVPEEKLAIHTPQFSVFRNRTAAEKEALFKQIRFVREVPAGALVLPEHTVNHMAWLKAKKEKHNILTGSLQTSSISNVAYVRQCGMQVCLMTAKTINDVVTGLILQPDYLVLDPALDIEKIKQDLLSLKLPPENTSLPECVINYPASAGERPAGTSLRVMSYNILAHCWGGELPPVMHRAPEIANVIRNVAPDFAALQELDSIWYKLLEKQIAPYRFATNPGRDVMNAVIYDSTKYKQIDGGSLPYMRAVFIRNLRYVLLEDLKSGRKYLFTNTHWDLSNKTRLKNAELMTQYLKELQKKYPGVPVISAGDFNCVVTSQPFQNLLKDSGFSDAADVAVKSENKFQSSYTRPRYAERPTPGKRHIDHLLVSGDWNVLSTKLLIAPILFRISDHLPVVSDLQLKAR